MINAVLRNLKLLLVEEWIFLSLRALLRTTYTPFDSLRRRLMALPLRIFLKPSPPVGSLFQFENHEIAPGMSCCLNR